MLTVRQFAKGLVKKYMKTFHFSAILPLNLPLIGTHRTPIVFVLRINLDIIIPLLVDYS